MTPALAVNAIFKSPTAVFKVSQENVKVNVLDPSGFADSALQVQWSETEVTSNQLAPTGVSAKFSE